MTALTQWSCLASGNQLDYDEKNDSAMKIHQILRDAGQRKLAA